MINLVDDEVRKSRDDDVWKHVPVYATKALDKTLIEVSKVVEQAKLVENGSTGYLGDPKTFEQHYKKLDADLKVFRQLAESARKHVVG